MMKWISLLLVSLLALSFACAPTVIEGKKVDSAKLKEMSPGLTSKAQVEQTFGNPPGWKRFPRGRQVHLCLPDHGSGMVHH